MYNINSANMIDNSILVALEYDRNSAAFKDFANSGRLVITHIEDKKGSKLDFSCTDKDVFDISISDLDLEEVRGRANCVIRIDRNPNEKIVIELDARADQLQQNFMFICKIKENSFLLFAEQPFVITNKIYSAPSYNRSDTDLKENLKAQIDEILNGAIPNVYNRQRAIECRLILLSLEEIITGDATSALREKAYIAKERIQNELERVRLLKNKTHLAKTFKDKLLLKKYELMEEFINENAGKQALAKIHSSAMIEVKKQLHINNEVVGSLIDVEEEQTNERDRVLETLKRNKYFEEFERFVSRGDKPPSLVLQKCKKCGKKPRIEKTTTANGRTKRFIAVCQCGARADDGKIGADAVINWNLVNADDLAVNMINIVDFEGLSRKDVTEKIGSIDQFCHRRRRLISIDQQLSEGVDKSSFNKIKGMISVLSAVGRYAKEIMKHNNELA